jgi:hypothetical protein
MNRFTKSLSDRRERRREKKRQERVRRAKDDRQPVAQVRRGGFDAGDGGAGHG